jgi:hypothetical protein
MSASRRGLERDGYAYVPPREDGLSGQDAWDDSALMDAYNSAVERYKITHGLGAGSASGAARATLSPSVGGSRNATPASPARGGIAGAPPRSPAPASPAPRPRRSPLPGNPATSAPDPRSAPGGEAASWDAYYAHYAAHAHAPSQGEYYDPYYGYDAAPPPSHDYPGRHPPHPRQRFPGAPAFPGGFHHPPPPPPRGYGGPAGPPGPRAPRGAYDAYGHHYGTHGGPPPPPPLGGDVGRRARAAAASALDSGAAGDYEGAHPDADVDELANLLMAWYYAGYYTGQYSKRGGGEDEAGEEGGY